MEHIEFQGKQYHLVCGGCGVKLTYEIVDGDYVVAPHECVVPVPKVEPTVTFPVEQPFFTAEGSATRYER